MRLKYFGIISGVVIGTKIMPEIILAFSCAVISDTPYPYRFHLLRMSLRFYIVRFIGYIEIAIIDVT